MHIAVTDVITLDIIQAKATEHNGTFEIPSRKLPCAQRVVTSCGEDMHGRGDSASAVHTATALRFSWVEVELREDPVLDQHQLRLCLCDKSFLSESSFLKSLLSISVIAEWFFTEVFFLCIHLTAV